MKNNFEKYSKVIVNLEEISSNTFAAVNSLKIDFGDLGYIWVDPPWEILYQDKPFISDETCPSNYEDENYERDFENWASQMDKLKNVKVERFKLEECRLEILFENKYKLVVDSSDLDKDFHWYLSIQIRKANIEDSRAIAEINTLGWQKSYKGIVDQNFLDNMSIDESEKRWIETFQKNRKNITFLVAELAGKVVGFVRAGEPKMKVCGVGEITAIYVHPDFTRQGIGSRLINEAEKYLEGQGYKSGILRTLAENEPTIDFYKKHGWEVERESYEEVFGMDLLLKIMSKSF